jgi:hypothetical protein
MVLCSKFLYKVFTSKYVAHELMMMMVDDGGGGCGGDDGTVITTININNIILFY